MIRDHLLGYPPVLAALYPDDSPRRPILTTPRAPMTAADKAARRALDPGSGKAAAPPAQFYRMPFGGLYRVSASLHAEIWTGRYWIATRHRALSIVARGVPCADPSL